jgi:hypothetical protein
MKLETRIRRLTQAGKLQREITQLTGISRSSVYRIQKLLGLTLKRHGIRCPEITPNQEKEIIGLLSAGLGTGKIATRLGLRQHGVRRVAERNGFRRKDVWAALAPTVCAKVIAEIHDRRNHGLHIAAKYNIPYKLILRIAHRELACPKFRSGRSEPLSSNFPQRNSQQSLRQGKR